MLHALRPTLTQEDAPQSGVFPHCRTSCHSNCNSECSIPSHSNCYKRKISDEGSVKSLMLQHLELKKQTGQIRNSNSKKSVAWQLQIAAAFRALPICSLNSQLTSERMVIIRQCIYVLKCTWTHKKALCNCTSSSLKNCEHHNIESFVNQWLYLKSGLLRLFSWSRTIWKQQAKLMNLIGIWHKVI